MVGYDVAQIDRELSMWSIPLEFQLVPPLHHLAPHRDVQALCNVGILLGNVSEGAIGFERGTVTGDDDGDELAQSTTLQNVYRRGYEDDRMVGVIELKAIAVDENDSCVRTEKTGREHV